MTRPSERQVEAAAEVTRWYFATHRGARLEPGMPAMYADPARVGHFAVELDALRSGEPGALFRALVTTAMFQRLRDVLVLKILRTTPEELAVVLCDEHRLRELAGALPCGLGASVEALRRDCDLAKHRQTKRGICSRVPAGSCRLHTHTEALKRYGHFGKVPTSIALAVAAAGAQNVGELHERATSGRTPAEAAEWLIGALTRAWRVSDKIAAMYLSLVCNPDVLPGAPWSDGVDWTRFVVVDSNVDRFLESIDYDGRGTYSARAQFVRRLAESIDLRELDGAVQPYNPRLVQQAIYLFMSRSNRVELEADCSHEPQSCASCPELLRVRCPLAH